MSESISDDQFKASVMQFIEIAKQKFDGLASDARTSSFNFDRLEQKVDNLSSKSDSVERKAGGLEQKIDGLASDFRTFSAQFNHVGSQAIKDTKRIESLETRVGVLESEVH